MMIDELWYKDGLFFHCTRCGNCCCGPPGTVRVTDDEIAALSQHLGLTEAEFRSMYTRPLLNGESSLREKQNYECIFFDESQGCTVYKSRPRQCRTWPFWRDNVCSPERWAETTAKCPGMNVGPLHSAALIKQTSDHDGA